MRITKLILCIIAIFSAFSAYSYAGMLVNAPNFWNGPPTIDGQMGKDEWGPASVTLANLTSDGGNLTAPFCRVSVGRSGNTLNFLFVVDSMTRMPVAKATERDGKLWEDDAVELFLTAGPTNLQLIVNSKGIIFDHRNGDKSWDGPWKVAASVIGTDFAMGGDVVKRGFIVEAALDMQTAGLEIPAQGTRWGMQVALDLVGKNPAAVWAPMSGVNFKDGNAGQLLFGDPTNRLELVTLDDDGRTLHLQGWFGEYVGGEVQKRGSDVSDKQLWIRDANETVKVSGGSDYTYRVSSPNFDYSFKAHAKLAVPIVAAPVPGKKAFYIACDPTKLPQEDKHPLRLTVIQKDQPYWTEAIDLVALTTKKTWWVDYTKLSPGQCTLLIEQKVDDGKFIKLGEIALKIPDYTPEWASFKLPDIDVVPVPWTPVKASAKYAGVYSRTYRFGSSIFLDQVNAVGKDILASSVALKGTIDSKPLKWRMSSWKLQKSLGHKAIYVGKAVSQAFAVDVTTTIEYDGMMRMDWTLSPIGGKQVVKDLQFVVPVKRSIARSFMQYNVEGYSFNDQTTWNRSGDVTDAGWKCKFTPFFWLGDQERGIQWFAENRSGWTPADKEKAIEVLADKNAANLVLHISDGERVFDKPVSFTFGLMASPVKPRLSPDDLTGDRIMVLTAPVQTTAKSRNSTTITIPAGMSQMNGKGSVEVDLRVDWDPNDPMLGQPRMNIFTYGNSQGNYIALTWSPTNHALKISHFTAEFGENVVFEVPVEFKRGKWYRIGVNYGQKTGLYLDGKKIASGDDVSSMPVFDYFCSVTFQCDAKYALAGWRLTTENRPEDSFTGSGPLTADAATYNLEDLCFDPTPMNLCYSTVGNTQNPAYLSGNWKYDKINKWLIPLEAGPEIPNAEIYAKIGMRGFVYFLWSVSPCGIGGPSNPAELQQCADLLNKNNQALLPYTGWGISNKSREYEDYKWDISTNPPDMDPPVGWRESGEALYGICTASEGAKKLLWEIDNTMKMGCGGVYLDGVVGPPECSNPLHGHEPIIDPVSGKAIPSWRIFDRRDYLKQMYILIKSHRKDAVMDAHCSGGYPLPTASFITSATNGESLGAIRDWQKFSDLDVFRAEYLARQFGFNSEPLFYNNLPLPVEYGITLAGIHGTMPRTMWGTYPQRAEGIWKLSDQFETKTAEWMPYYTPGKNAFTPENPNVKVSAFVHKGKQTLLLVTNWSDNPGSNRIKINWKKLGLKSNAAIVEVNWNRPVKVNGDYIEPEIRNRKLTYIWIGKK